MGQILRGGRKQMMKFALAQLEAVFALSEPIPDEDDDPILKAKRVAWIEADYQCKNRILNSLSNDLYNVYASYEYASTIWNALEKKYSLDDAGSKRYVTANFLNFKMKDDMNISMQIDLFQVLVGNLVKEGINLPETFVAGALIEKLLSSWNDFKSHMKHKTKDLTLDQIIVRVKIEEKNREKDKVRKAKEFNVRIL